MPQHSSNRLHLGFGLLPGHDAQLPPGPDRFGSGADASRRLGGGKSMIRTIKTHGLETESSALMG